MMARNNSRKAQARRLRAATGESYTSAVRRLTENGGQLDVAVDPTDAQLALEVLSRLGYEDTDITTGWLPYMPGVDVDHRLPLLTVDLGDQPSGLPVSLSFMDPRYDGGPHGAVIGAPGSGKSTMLHSVAFALCALHSPQSLRLLLIPAWRPSAFDDFAQYPHVAAIPAEGERSLVLRQLIDDRREAVRKRLPVPNTVVLVDDYVAAALSDPDLYDVLDTLLQVESSLGIRVLLASQDIPGPRGRALLARTHYQVAMRTTTEQQSRDMIGVVDASYVPRAAAGTAFYRPFRGAPLVRFQAMRTPRSLVRAVGRRLKTDGGEWRR